MLKCWQRIPGSLLLVSLFAAAFAAAQNIRIGQTSINIFSIAIIIPIP